MARNDIELTRLSEPDLLGHFLELLVNLAHRGIDLLAAEAVPSRLCVQLVHTVHGLADKALDERTIGTQLLIGRRLRKTRPLLVDLFEQAIHRLTRHRRLLICQFRAEICRSAAYPRLTLCARHRERGAPRDAAVYLHRHRVHPIPFPVF